MHVSKADLEPVVMGEYEGRTVDWGDFRVAFETMPEQFPPDESPFAGLPDSALHASVPRRDRVRSPRRSTGGAD